MNLNEIIYCFIGILFASFIQGMAGFGFALISVPILTLSISPKVLVAIIVLYSAITNIFIIFKVRKFVRLKEIWMLIIFGIMGIPFGTYILKVVDTNIIKLIVGIVIIITVIIMFKGIKVKFKNIKFTFGVVGFLSGLLNGSISMSGPPVVLFLSNQEFDKNSFRANLTIYALILNIITIIVFLISGLINEDVTRSFLTYLPALISGTIIGIIISGKIREVEFKRIVLLLIAVAGLFIICDTLKNML